MFDITTQSVQDTATIHIKNAAGEPLYADAERTKPVQIVIYGPGSKAFGAAEARQSARAVKRMNDNELKLSTQTHEEKLKETAEDLASVTVSFVNFAYPPAKGAEGRELFEAVYRDPKLGFIVKQLNKAVADWGNFTPGSAAA
jgi:hypothetical protein